MRRCHKKTLVCYYSCHHKNRFNSRTIVAASSSILILLYIVSTLLHIVALFLSKTMKMIFQMFEILNKYKKETYDLSYDK